MSLGESPPNSNPTPTAARSQAFPTVLVAGAIANGAAAAGAMWLASAQLGLDGFAPLAQLWTIWGLVATGFVFGFQQWEIARNREGAPGSPARRIPSLVVLGIGVAAAVLGAAVWLWRIRLFGTGDWGWWAASASLPAGTALTGLSYAVLARRRQLGGLAALTAAENIVRLGTTAILVALDAGPHWFALSVPIGFLVAAGPAVTELRSDLEPGMSESAVGAGEVAAMASVGFATNLVFFGSPLVLGLSGGSSAEISALFLILIPLRVPFLLAQALLPAFAVHANDRVIQRRATDLGHLSRRLSGVAIVAAVVLGLAGVALGDSLASLVFGIGGELGDGVYGMYGAAMPVGLALFATNVILIATSRLRSLAIGWVIAVAATSMLVFFDALSTPVAVAVWSLVTYLLMLTIHHMSILHSESRFDVGQDA